MKHGIEVTFWGTRGSMAAPFPDRMKYGGNTSCVSLEWSGGIVIFDGGTGLREFGLQLVDRNVKEVHIFISHLHLDHIIGLPFFPLLFEKDCKLHLYVRHGENREFQTALTRICSPPYWPVRLEQAAAEIIWHEILAGDEIILPDEAKLYVMEADHPNGSFLYRFESDGVSAVYGLDCELTEPIRGAYETFVRESDLLIFDGTYTNEEYPKVAGYGHATWEQGIEIMKTCNVKSLCISHHDWGRTDEELEKMEKVMKKTAPGAQFVREGMTIILK